MKGFLATFDTREYININNIQEVNTYCYNNIHNPDILLFRESKVTECIWCRRILYRMLSRTT